MSLVSLGHPFASPGAQLRILNDSFGPWRSFESALEGAGLAPLTATRITVLQINVGKLCNQVCHHCHVDAGPDRKETMNREVAELCMRALETTDIPTVDITGGAPELNPNFRWLVERSRGLGREVIDRSNLTVLLLPSQAGLPEFLASHRVEIIASLPYYQEAETDAQRGDGVFRQSVAALLKLNALGYGRPESGLRLNLVYNPCGAYLPPAQASIEEDFKRELYRRHGIVFNSLYTIANMPISRFLEFLMRSGNYGRYMDKLSSAFNPAAAANVMCRYTLSVGWDGTLYDRDYNQMLGLAVGNGSAAHIRDFDAAGLANREILVGQHCYGCTAGSGSSCRGAVVR